MCYLTEVPVTADRPYKCTEEAACLRFVINGTDPAADNLTGRLDWARSDLTGKCDKARTPVSTPLTLVALALPSPSPVAIAAAVVGVLSQACANALNTFSAALLTLLNPPTSSATTLMVYSAHDTGISLVVARPVLLMVVTLREGKALKFIGSKTLSGGTLGRVRLMDDDTARRRAWLLIRVIIGCPYIAGGKWYVRLIR